MMFNTVAQLIRRLQALTPEQQLLPVASCDVLKGRNENFLISIVALEPYVMSDSRSKQGVVIY